MAIEGAAQGARNLLLNCAGIRPGDSVLIVGEPPGLGHYDERLADLVAAQAAALGARATVIRPALTAGPDDLPTALIDAIAAAAHTIFLSRIGDQLRFRALPGTGTKSMCYTLDLDLLGDDFGRVPHALFGELGAIILERLTGSTSYRLTCPQGSDATMELAQADRPQAPLTTAFTIRNFPTMIGPPISAAGLTGRLVFSQTLTSTYIHQYEDPILPLAQPLGVTVEKGRITGFDGPEALVDRVRRHFDRVGAIFGGDALVVNSWHAGINGTTRFAGPALADIDRWSCVAFGSPRYAHFHMAGAAPGEICGQIFDPTIRFDDTIVWDRGDLAYPGPAALTDLAARHAIPSDTLRTRRDIGLSLDLERVLQ